MIRCQKPDTDFQFITSYDAMLAEPAGEFSFPDFDENSRATTFYTTGTTGDPKAVAYSHRQLVIHTLGVMAGLGPMESSNRLHRGDTYMPITPMFHVHAWGFPLCGDAHGDQTGLSRAVCAGKFTAAYFGRRCDLHALRAHHCGHAAGCARG